MGHCCWKMSPTSKQCLFFTLPLYIKTFCLHTDASFAPQFFGKNRLYILCHFSIKCPDNFMYPITKIRWLFPFITCRTIGWLLFFPLILHKLNFIPANNFIIRSKNHSQVICLFVVCWPLRNHIKFWFFCQLYRLEVFLCGWLPSYLSSLVPLWPCTVNAVHVHEICLKYSAQRSKCWPPKQCWPDV